MRFPLVTALLLCFFCLSCGPERVPYTIKSQTIYVEVADTSEDRKQGLMNRKNLKKNHGMLFIFETTAPHRFWMKNTPLSLDIIWLSEALKIVHIYKNAVPNSTKIITPPVKARYVLEINAGLSEEWGLRVGDRLIKPTSSQ